MKMPRLVTLYLNVVVVVELLRVFVQILAVF